MRKSNKEHFVVLDKERPSFEEDNLFVMYLIASRVDGNMQYVEEAVFLKDFLFVDEDAE
jgi:hypothetical protein